MIEPCECATKPQLLNYGWRAILKVASLPERELAWTADDLEQIVAHNNQRYIAGERSCLSIGHTDQTAEELRCVGYIDQMRLGEWDGVPAIWAQFLVFDDELATLPKYGRVSVEIDTDGITIPTVALLGGSQPALELGTLLSKDGKRKFLATNIDIDKGASMQISDEIKAAFEELINDLPEIAFVRELIQSQEASKDDGDSPEEMEADEDQEQMEDDKKSDDDQEDESMADDDEDKKDDDEEKEALAKEVKRLRKQYSTAKRETALLSLVQEGYNIDVEEETAYMADMSDVQVAKYLPKLQKMVGKTPIKLMKKFDVEQIHTGNEEPISSDTMTAIRELADRERVDYATAKKMYFK